MHIQPAARSQPQHIMLQHSQSQPVQMHQPIHSLSQQLQSQQPHHDSSSLSDSLCSPLDSSCSKASAVQRPYLSPDSRRFASRKAHPSREPVLHVHQPLAEISCSSQVPLHTHKVQSQSRKSCKISMSPVSSKQAHEHGKGHAGVRAWPPPSPSPKKFMHSQNRRPVDAVGYK